MPSCRSGIIGRIGAASPCDGDLHHIDADSDWAEDLGQDDDDSAAEDSVSNFRVCCTSSEIFRGYQYFRYVHLYVVILVL